MQHDMQDQSHNPLYGTNEKVNLWTLDIMKLIVKIEHWKLKIDHWTHQHWNVCLISDEFLSFQSDAHWMCNSLPAKWSGIFYLILAFKTFSRSDDWWKIWYFWQEWYWIPCLVWKWKSQQKSEGWLATQDPIFSNLGDLC